MVGNGSFSSGGGAPFKGNNQSSSRGFSVGAPVLISPDAIKNATVRAPTMDQANFSGAFVDPGLAGRTAMVAADGLMSVANTLIENKKYSNKLYEENASIRLNGRLQKELGAFEKVNALDPTAFTFDKFQPRFDAVFAEEAKRSDSDATTLGLMNASFRANMQAELDVRSLNASENMVTNQIVIKTREAAARTDEFVDINRGNGPALTANLYAEAEELTKMAMELEKKNPIKADVVIQKRNEIFINYVANAAANIPELDTVLEMESVTAEVNNMIALGRKNYGIQFNENSGAQLKGQLEDNIKLRSDKVNSNEFIMEKVVETVRTGTTTMAPEQTELMKPENLTRVAIAVYAVKAIETYKANNGGARPTVSQIIQEMAAGFNETEEVMYLRYSSDPVVYNALQSLPSEIKGKTPAQSTMILIDSEVRSVKNGSYTNLAAFAEADKAATGNYDKTTALITSYLAANKLTAEQFLTGVDDKDHPTVKEIFLHNKKTGSDGQVLLDQLGGAIQVDALKIKGYKEDPNQGPTDLQLKQEQIIGGGVSSILSEVPGAEVKLGLSLTEDIVRGALYLRQAQDPITSNPDVNQRLPLGVKHASNISGAVESIRRAKPKETAALLKTIVQETRTTMAKVSQAQVSVGTKSVADLTLLDSFKQIADATKGPQMKTVFNLLSVQPDLVDSEFLQSMLKVADSDVTAEIEVLKKQGKINELVKSATDFKVLIDTNANSAALFAMSQDMFLFNKVNKEQSFLDIQNMVLTSSVYDMANPAHIGQTMEETIAGRLEAMASFANMTTFKSSGGVPLNFSKEHTRFNINTWLVEPSFITFESTDGSLSAPGRDGPNGFAWAQGPDGAAIILGDKNDGPEFLGSAVQKMIFGGQVTLTSYWDNIFGDRDSWVGAGLSNEDDTPEPIPNRRPDLYELANLQHFGYSIEEIELTADYIRNFNGDEATETAISVFGLTHWFTDKARLTSSIEIDSEDSAKDKAEFLRRNPDNIMAKFGSIKMPSEIAARLFTKEESGIVTEAGDINAGLAAGGVRRAIKDQPINSFPEKNEKAITAAMLTYAIDKGMFARVEGGFTILIPSLPVHRMVDGEDVSYPSPAGGVFEVAKLDERGKPMKDDQGNPIMTPLILPEKEVGMRMSSESLNPLEKMFQVGIKPLPGGNKNIPLDSNNVSF